MSINNQILDGVLDHSAMLRLVEEGLSRDLDLIYDKHRDSLRDIINKGGNPKALERKVAREVNRHINRTYKQLTPALRSIISAEADFATDLLDTRVGDIFRVRNTPKTPLLSLIGTEPLRDSGILSKQLQNIGNTEVKNLNSIIKRGIAAGTPTDKIASQVADSGALKISKAQSKTLVRTAITQYSTTASELVYKQNAAIIQGYQYVATLDNRTTQICARNDGKVYQVADASAPRPPLHWNCRSTTVPVVKGFSEIDPTNGRVKSKNLKNLSKKRRASFDGQVAEAESYSSWLKGQPYATQLRHLQSPERVELFQEGGLKLSQFTNFEGKLLTVAALRKLDIRANKRPISRFNIRTLFCRSPCKDYDDPNVFHIKTERTVVTSTRDFYDGPDSNNLHNSFVGYILYHARSQALGLAEFRGSTFKGKKAQSAKIYEEPDSLRYNRITGQVEHTALQDTTQLHVVLDRIREQIRDDKILTKSDKDYLLGRFDAELEVNVQGTAHASALVTAHRAFRITREGGLDEGNSFEDIFKRNLYSKTSGVLEVSNRIERLNRSGTRFTDKIVTDEVGILGEGYSIQKVIDDYPAALRTIDDWKLQTKLVDDVYDVTKNSNNPVVKLATKDDLSVILTDIFRRPTLPNNLDELQRDIGRRLWDKYGGRVSQLEIPATQRDLWLAGEQVIDGLRNNKYITVRIQSIRKPRQKDPLYNESGPIGYYTQRYIEVTDMSLFNLREAFAIKNKRIRLGWKPDEFPFIAKAGNVYYHDRFTGKLTDVPIRTSGKTTRRDAVNQQLADEVNRNNSIIHNVDNDSFANPMAKYMSTVRGAKGNTSGGRTDVQNEIYKRNDYETLATLRYYLEDENQGGFRVLHGVQESTRDTHLAILSPGSGEFWRPGLSKHAKIEIGTETNYQLFTQRFAVIIDKTTYNTDAKRKAWFESMRTPILELGEILDKLHTSKVAIPRAVLKKLDGNALWQQLGPDDKNVFGSFAFEYYRIVKSAKGSGRKNPFKFPDDPKVREAFYKYKSSVLAEFDVSESGTGLQISMLRRKKAADIIGLTPQEANIRLRERVADELMNTPGFRDTYPFLTRKDLIALIKDGITTSGYGSPDFEIASRAIKVSPRTGKGGLREAFQKEGNILEVNKKTLTRVIDRLDEIVRSGNLSTADKLTIKKLKSNINYSARNTKVPQDDLLTVGRYLDPEAQQVVYKLAQGNVITQRQMHQIGRSVNEAYDLILEGRKDYFRFTEDLLDSYIFRDAINGNIDGNVPIRSFDGVESNLSFFKRERYKAEVQDRNGETVLIDIASEEVKAVDIQKARQSFGVDFTFAQDSAIARIHSSRGRSTVYDGFNETIGDLSKMIDDNVDGYKLLIQSDVLLEQIELMVRYGLPEADYRFKGRTFKGAKSLRLDLKRLLGSLKPEDLDGVWPSKIID